MLRGGLGNQLFQYSAGLFFAKRTGARLLLDAQLLPRRPDSLQGISRWPESLSAFNHSGSLVMSRNQPEFGTSFTSKVLTLGRILSEKRVVNFLKLGVVLGDGGLSLDQLLSKAEAIRYLDGYFINRHFVHENSDQIREEIKSLVAPSSRYVEFQKETSGKLAIHLRFGDFMLSDGNLHGKYMEYLADALRLQNQLNSANGGYVLFSDDPNRAEQLLAKLLPKGKRAILPPADLSPVETLNLMGRCEGLIGSSSTFSWWGGFLQADAQVILPRPWERNSACEKRDVLLQNWISIG